MSTGDYGDKSSAVEELHRDVAIRKRKETGPKAIGVCYYCGEPLESGLRWCDIDCRDDWEEEKRRRDMP